MTEKWIQTLETILRGLWQAISQGLPAEMQGVKQRDHARAHKSARKPPRKNDGRKIRPRRHIHGKR